MAESMRFEQRMSDSDALMWTIEKDPMLRSTITAIVVLDRAPDRERFHALLDRGTRLVPRMRQVVRSNPLSLAPPRWELDPNFDLSFHVRWVRAAGKCDLRSVLDLAEPIAMQSFDRARPLWEFTVVEGLSDGKAAIIMKVHHAVTDGIGAVKIALVMFELERDAAPPDMPDEPDVVVMSQLQRFVDAFQHVQRRNLGIAKRSTSTVGGAVGGVARDPVGSARRAMETAESVVRMVSPATVPISELMRGRSLSVHFDVLDIPLDRAKEAARAAGGRLNDAFVAATAEGFRRYHQELGGPVPDALRLQMPISIRSGDNEDLMGNQFVPARFPIPLDIDDPLERMRAMHDIVAHERAEPALSLVEPLARFLNQLPTAVSTGIFGAMLKGIDLVASNVPGAPFPIFTSGSRIEAMYALGPMAGAASNITLLSYCDHLHIGVNVDPAGVAEPDRLMRCYRSAWDDLLDMA